MTVASRRGVYWAIMASVFAAVASAQDAWNDDEKHVEQLVRGMKGGLLSAIDGKSDKIELALRAETLTEKEVREFAKVRNLKQLNFDSTTITDAAWKEFASLKPVEAISLANGIPIGRHEMDCLASMKNLRALRFVMSSDITIDAWRSLGGITKLKEFEAPKIPVEGWQSLMTMELSALKGEPPDGDLKGLGKQTGLLRLEFPGVKFLTERGFDEIAKIESLRELELSDTDLSEVAFKYIGKMKNLESIHLSDTAISDDSAASIAKLTKLKSARLDHCSFGDKVVASLAVLPKLEVLIADGSNLNDVHLQLLGQARQLRQLSLVDAKCSASAIEVLKTRLPKCSVRP